MQYTAEIIGFKLEIKNRRLKTLFGNKVQRLYPNDFIIHYLIEEQAILAIGLRTTEVHVQASEFNWQEFI